MKSLLYYLTGISGIIYFVCLPHIKHASLCVDVPEIPHFTGDSGYITPASLHNLLVIQPSDTLFRMNKDTTPTDTIGKYYKMANGNFIASVTTIDSYDYEINTICEATAYGTIIKKEGYSFGMYRCCWDNAYDGFQKHGDYYTFLSCGTGSAHCGGGMYIFKEVLPQEGQKVIINWSWSWEGPDKEDYYTTLTSKMKIKNDSIFMHYTNKLYKEKHKKQKIKKLEEFDVTYVLRNGKWMATDSIRIKDFDY